MKYIKNFTINAKSLIILIKVVKKVLIIVGIVVLILMVGFGVYWFYTLQRIDDIGHGVGEGCGGFMDYTCKTGLRCYYGENKIMNEPIGECVTEKDFTRLTK